MTELRTLNFPLVGPGGEPIDLWRTMQSHGIAELPPAAVDPANRSMALVVRLPGNRATTVTIRGEDP